MFHHRIVKAQGSPGPFRLSVSQMLERLSANASLRPYISHAFRSRTSGFGMPCGANCLKLCLEGCRKELVHGLKHHSMRASSWQAWTPLEHMARGQWRRSVESKRASGERPRPRSCSCWQRFSTLSFGASTRQSF